MTAIAILIVGVAVGTPGAVVASASADDAVESSATGSVAFGITMLIIVIIGALVLRKARKNRSW